jgi:hypothetical protein
MDMLPQRRRNDELKHIVLIFTAILLLLFCLGIMACFADTKGNTVSAGSGTPWDLTGEWGGDGIRLVVTEASAKMEFDCAFGEVDGPIKPDKDGNFEVQGVYMLERGGPGRMNEPPLRRRPAVYRGWTNGKEMHLTVNLLEGREVGSFTLEKGRRASLDKCL